MTLSRRGVIGGMIATTVAGAAKAQAPFPCTYGPTFPQNLYSSLTDRQVTNSNATKIVFGSPINFSDYPEDGAWPSEGLHFWSRQKGVSFGAAMEVGSFNDPIPAQQAAYRSALLTECGHINDPSVPTMTRVWGTGFQPTNEAVYAQVDAVVNFATSNNRAVRLIPLVWYQGMPFGPPSDNTNGWAAAYFAPSSPARPASPTILRNVDMRNAEGLMRAWITAMMGRYRGRVEAWDVVNEVETGISVNGPWHRTLGPSYIENAFRIAREVDPKARLVLNEEDTDHSSNDGFFQGRRTALLRRIERLKARGVPVDTVGLQAHISSIFTLDQNVIRNFLSELAQLGVSIEITELDIDDRNFSAANQLARDSNVKAFGKAYLDVVMDEPNVIGVTVWGYTIPQRLPRLRQQTYGTRTGGSITIPTDGAVIKTQASPCQAVGLCAHACSIGQHRSPTT